MAVALEPIVEEVVTAELPNWIKQRPEFRQRLEAAMGVGSDQSSYRRMSYEEFLEWADEDTLAEWVEGEVIMASPASSRHQAISSFLESVLSLFSNARGLGTVLRAPFQMKLANSGREPDLLFVSAEHVSRLGKTFLDGPADLAVEVLSPESIGRDRGDKFIEYAHGGVPEYWLIDPNGGWADFYRLAEGHYHLSFEGKEGRYDSLVVPGFWLDVEWLWQEPLPLASRVLAEIVGMEAAVADAFERALAGKGQ